MCQEGGFLSKLHLDRNPCAQDPSGPLLTYLFVWLFICICILYNEPVIVKCFLEFCELFQQMIKHERGRLQEPRNLWFWG